MGKTIYVQPPIIVKELAQRMDASLYQLIHDLANMSVFVRVDQSIKPEVGDIHLQAVWFSSANKMTPVRRYLCDPYFAVRHVRARLKHCKRCGHERIFIEGGPTLANLSLFQFPLFFTVVRRVWSGSGNKF